MTAIKDSLWFVWATAGLYLFTDIWFIDWQFWVIMIPLAILVLNFEHRSHMWAYHEGLMDAKLSADEIKEIVNGSRK